MTQEKVCSQGRGKAINERTVYKSVSVVSLRKTSSDEGYLLSFYASKIYLNFICLEKRLV